MSKYINGKIYKITENNILPYYGSTINTIAQRKAKHIYSMNKSSDGRGSICGYGFSNNFKIELVESYPCNSNDELRTRERFFIENNNCVNKNKAIRTEEEDKEWRRKYKLTDEYKHKKCLCGAMSSVSNIARHIKSKSHIKFIQDNL